MQKRLQTLLHLVGVLLDACNFPGVVNAKDEYAALRVCESAYRLAHRRQVAKSAFEFGFPGFAGLNAFERLGPIHFRML